MPDQEFPRLQFHRAISSAIVAAAFVAAIAPTAQAGQSASPPILLAQMSDDEAAGAPPVEDPGNAAAQTVRIDRLENSVRSLTGQIEQLQFQNRKLADDLRKVQQDVDFRFQDLERAGSRPAGGVPQKRSEAPSPVGNPAGLPMDASGAPAASDVTPVPAKPARRVGDAFDPDSNPNAPGAPRPLGTSTPSAPLPGRRDAANGAVPNAPLDLMKRQPVDTGGDQSTENGVAAISPEAVPVDPVPRAALNPNAVASLAPGGTRDEYNADLDLYRQGQYDNAATGLKSFVDKYPRDRMVPDAVYLLGETYSKLGRHREAAEQYLRLSTDFSKAPRAPDALLRLGMSLNAMGVREQACATYQEVTRRFPAASADVRASVDRELKRARC